MARRRVRGRLYVDHDPLGNPDIHLHVDVSVEGDDLTIDYTGTDTRNELQAWSTFGNTRGYTVGQIAAMMDPEIPKNEGFFEQIKLIVPKGCLLNPEPGKPVSAGTHHPGADVGEVIAVAMQHVLPERAVPQTYKTGIPTIIVGVDPRTGATFTDHSAEVYAGWCNAVEGHGRVGRAQRELRQPLEGDGRDQRVAVPARAVEPRLPHRLRRARRVARHLRSHYEKEVRVDAKVYTYVVGMKYPMPGICGGKQRRAERDDHPVRQRRRVQGRRTPPTGCRCRPASASCTTTAVAAVGAIPSTATRRPCSTTCSTSTCRSRAPRRDYGVVLTGSLEDLTLAIDEAATHRSCAPTMRADGHDMGYRVGVDVGGTFTDLICVTPDRRGRARQDADTLDDQSTRRDERPRAARRAASASTLDAFCARPRHPRARHHHRRQHDDRDERRADRAARHRGPPRRDRAAALPQGRDLGPELSGPDPDRPPAGAHPDPERVDFEGDVAARRSTRTPCAAACSACRSSACARSR